MYYTLYDIWCINLLKEWRYPQLKVWPWGKLYFCCDMHDPLTEWWTTENLIDPIKRKSFIDQTRKNPYILLCAALNPCSFSVNYVTYDTSKKADNAMEKTPFTQLTADELLHVQQWCEWFIDDWRLVVLPETDKTINAFITLRKDYLDKKLPLSDRAIKNITISPKGFHQASGILTDKLVSLLQEKEWGNIFPLYPWRAALVFLHGFAKWNVWHHLHIGIARNEETLEVEEYVPLDLSHEGIHDWKIVISDPMLATWGSMIYVIEKLISEWIKEENIILTCIFAAPEGIDNILSKYSKVKIYTWVLDSHLNELWFIVPWLWDFWDKWSEGVTRGGLENIKEYFTKEQFTALLEKYWFE